MEQFLAFIQCSINISQFAFYSLICYPPLFPSFSSSFSILSDFSLFLTSLVPPNTLLGLSWWLSGKESTCNAGDAAGAMGSIPRLGRSSGEGNGNPLHYSYLENLMHRGVWWATNLCKVKILNLFGFS